MSPLEGAFARLAGAIDALETKLDQRLDDLEATRDAHELTRRRARIAGAYTRSAANELAASIDDLKALMDADDRPDDSATATGGATAESE